jgi:hypothetical protein
MTGIEHPKQLVTCYFIDCAVDALHISDQLTMLLEELDV